MNNKIKDFVILLVTANFACTPPEQPKIEKKSTAIKIPLMPDKRDISLGKNNYLDVIALGEKAINDKDFQSLLSFFRKNNLPKKECEIAEKK